MYLLQDAHMLRQKRLQTMQSKVARPGRERGGGRMTVESNLFDKEEIYPDCTVQVLTNTLTGETSVGWWPNDNPPRVASDCQKETP